MLRLLFCTAAILPIAIIPWMTSRADTAEAVSQDAVYVEETSYAELVTDPNIDALSHCDEGELPVFFREGLVTTHSAEFIAEGLEAAEGCGEVEVTIVPLLPEEAGPDEIAQMQHRTAELDDYVEAAADVLDTPVDIDVANEPVEEEITTLYINGRAAILKVDPQESHR